MVFLIYLAGYLAAVALLIWVVRLNWIRIAVIVLAAIVPTWDILPKQIYMWQVCSREATFRVPSDPIRVHGYLNSLRSWSPGPGSELDLAGGFDYIEARASYPLENEYVRASKRDDGTVWIEQIRVPTSRFRLERVETLHDWGARVVSTRVVDATADTVVAEDTFVAGGVPWVLSAIVPSEMRPGGGVCEPERPAGKSIYSDVFRPINEAR